MKVTHTEKEYQDLQKANWENCNFLGEKIEKLVEENKQLKSQLASVKYLNADEVEHIIGSINTNQEKIQAICNLAIDIDRDKIIKILHEFVVYQIEADNLINNEAVEYVADEIIKAIRGEE